MPRFFFGWVVVLASGIVALGGGLIFYGITGFINPIVHELNCGYFVLSLAFSLRSVEMGFVAPLTGFLADRWGPRLVAFGCGSMCALGFFWMSQIDTLLGFYLGFFVLSLGSSGLGHSVIVVAVANWFRRNLGKAMGLALAGYGLSGLLIPLMMDSIDSYGWRTTLIAMGCLTLVVILPASLFLRHRPEASGYTVDGDAPTEAGRDAAPSQDGDDARLSEALRTRAFWFLSVSMAVFFMALNGVTLYVVPYLEQKNIATGEAAFIAMSIPLASIPGRLFFGWLGDRITNRFALIISLLSMALGMVFFMQGSGMAHFVWFLLFFGLGFGGIMPLRGSILREYYGRLNFGAIHGTMLAVLTLGGMFGAAFTGWVRDATGNYHAAWLTFLICILAALPLVMLAAPHAAKICRGQGQA